MKNTMRWTGSSWMLVALAAGTLLATGCRGPWSTGWKYSDMLSPKKMAGWDEEELDPEVPRRIVSTWVDTVLHQSGKTPQRGFGGRLIFYGLDNEKPVLVDGQLVIYAFDETKREPTNNKPTRRYVFPPDQVARRMSKSTLGPSYSFWLPWDEVGGPQTEISLIARFEPKGGPIVIGEQTRHLLPGEMAAGTRIVSNVPPKLPDGIPMRPAAPTLASLAEQAQAAQNQVQMASYAGPVEQQPTAHQRRMTTTSISLPENFRVRGGAPTPMSNLPARNVPAEPRAMPQPAGIANALPAMHPLQQLQSAHPTFMTPQQSPLGNGFIAPLGQEQHPPQQVPNGVGQIIAPPQASGWETVNYPHAAGQAGSGMVLPQPSFGSPPQPLQAPTTPVFR